MNKPGNIRPQGSLLERASEVFDFRAHFVKPAAPAADAESGRVDEEVVPETLVEEAGQVADAGPIAQPARPKPVTVDGVAVIDRAALEEAGLINPDRPTGVLAEEFRIIKRQLLIRASAKTGVEDSKRRTIMVCSAEPGEGKTFCAVNLALSMTGEEDLDVLLIEGDFAKPDLLPLLGVEDGPGFVDTLIDTDLDPNSLVIPTDVRGLSILPAGRNVNNGTELLASARTGAVLCALTENHPKRILIFDSPPALVAAPAGVLASYAGQVMMVVRADKTTECDLREALSLLAACEDITLMLNGTSLAVSGRRFGTYYGSSSG